MSGVTTQSPSNLSVPGVYVDVQPPQQSISPNVATALNGFVGGANWGPVNQPVETSDASSILATWGNDTASTHSLVLELLNALTEDGSAVSVRQTDGSDAAATITMPDTASGTVLVLTAKYTGSLPNGNAALGITAAQCRIDLISGTPSVSPVYRITIFFPGQPPEVFNNILGYTPGQPTGPYNSATFKANALAAINGTAQNSVGSQFWVATAGSSTVSPLTATLESASGGADGTASLSITELVGQDSSAGARTGMYALRGTGFFHFAIAAMGIASGDLASVATVSAFVQSEGAALGFCTVPKGTSDSAAYGLRLSNAIVDDNMVIVKDFILIVDPVQQTQRYVSPLGKAMGIIGLLSPEISPIDQPYNTTGNSAAYVIGTEQSAIGPRSNSELAALIANGLIAITNQMALDNGAFGIFDDVCSSGDPNSNDGSGTYIPVQRMNTYLAQAIVQLLGQFVGKNQSVSPRDPLRAAIRATINNFLSQLAPNGGVQRIDTFNVTCDLTNNSPTSIAQGFCYVQVLVRFLGVARIIYVELQGGTNVITTTSQSA
jgi:uncharacterized protein